MCLERATAKRELPALTTKLKAINFLTEQVYRKEIRVGPTRKDKKRSTPTARNEAIAPAAVKTIKT